MLYFLKIRCSHDKVLKTIVSILKSVTKKEQATTLGTYINKNIKFTKKIKLNISDEENVMCIIFVKNNSIFYLYYST